MLYQHNKNLVDIFTQSLTLGKENYYINEIYRTLHYQKSEKNEIFFGNKNRENKIYIKGKITGGNKGIGLSSPREFESSNGYAKKIKDSNKKVKRYRQQIKLLGDYIIEHCLEDKKTPDSSGV